MPAHNEEDYLPAAVGSVVSELRTGPEPFELIIAENGSSDSTAAQAAELSSRYAEVRALRLPVPDYGLALRSGFLEARGDVVVNFDVDFVDVAFLRSALEVMGSTDAAIVVGSKRSPGADDRRGVGRRAVTAVFAGILKLGFGMRISDTHGVKALRRQAVAPVVDACRFNADIFDTELIIRAERAGLVVTEIPVVVNELRAPRTSIFRRIPRALLSLLRLRLALRKTG